MPTGKTDPRKPLVQQCEFCWPKPNELTEWVNGKRYKPQQVQRLHWYNQFTPKTLKKHLEGQEFDIETIEAALQWYETTEQALHDRHAEKIEDDRLRKWTLFARECKTPEEAEALAEETLNDHGKAAIKALTRLWRKFNTGEQISGSELEDALLHVGPGRGEESPIDDIARDLAKAKKMPKPDPEDYEP